MKITKQFEFPPELVKDFDKAKKLEKLTIIYILSAGFFIYLTMGSSQAMKTEFLEHILGLIPPISFLIASQIYTKAPNKTHPYGYHRVTSIAFLCGSLALSALGSYLLIDALTKLISMEYPTIGSMKIFGENIWQGWLMLATLTYSAIPAVIIGLKKLSIAEKLHDKVLFTDAEMNKADWMSTGAAFLGVLGIGLGFWWADAVAAAIISIDIIYDGFSNLKSSLLDLMDRIPETVDHKSVDPIVSKLNKMFNDLDWIESSHVRLREEGHVYFGEAVIIPKENTRYLLDRIKDARDEAHKLNWRIFDLVIMPVKEIPEQK